MIGLHAFEGNALTADRACNEKRARFDAVRNNVVLGTVQFSYALNDDSPSARTLDLCPHLVKEVCQIADFRFGGGAFDHGHAVCEDGGHHDIVSPQNSGAELAAQIDDRAREFRGENLHISALYPHGGPKRLETFQVKIDRPIANHATSRKRYGCFVTPA